jgi:hypothetical protein
MLDGGQRVVVESSSHDAGGAVGTRVGLKILGESVTIADPIADPGAYNPQAVPAASA